MTISGNNNSFKICIDFDKNTQPVHNIYSNVNIPETPDTGSDPEVLDYYFYALWSIRMLLALSTLLA